MRPVLQSRSNSQRGFTLLELLVATAVGAVVLLVVQTTFFGALRLNNSTHARIDQDLALQRALGIIRLDLAGIMLPGGTLSGELQSDNFTSTLANTFGEPVTPEIFTNSGKIDGWNPFSEVQMVSYSLAPAADGGKGYDLMRVVTRNLLPVQEAEPEGQVLLSGVDSASMLFYDGTAWIDSWDSATTQTLPKALRFSLVLTAKEGGQNTMDPIDLVVPVLVMTTTSEAEAEEEPAL